MFPYNLATRFCAQLTNVTAPHLSYSICYTTMLKTVPFYSTFLRLFNFRYQLNITALVKAITT